MKSVRNQRGQMAIFIALIFQVLFVLFAMAINIALVVHDKINLQNAVDLAAYYAAQRQAEILNVMAHQNYAIRQSWKLLTWRYRVLGTAGLQDPRAPFVIDNRADTPFSIPSPIVCVTHSTKWTVNASENLCKKELTRIPALPRVSVVAGFLGFNAVFAALADRLRAQMADNCSNFGAYNWWYTMGILQAFREDQRNRKQVIFGLANNLARGENGDFIDLDGTSVREGSFKTFQKNLTFANQQSQVSFRMLNSLQGVQPKQWLSEIQVGPVLYYMDPEPGEGCKGNAKLVDTLPDIPNSRTLIQSAPPNGLGANELTKWTAASVGFLRDSDYQFAVGVEKNPWMMAYVGIQAETAPRQIFFPFGGAVRLTARAFAKPFGGRMGPWDGSRWPRSAQESTGERTDNLLPPRFRNGGLMDDETDQRRFPNYSRYPGDQLGLKSQLAMNAMQGFFTGTPLDRIEYDNYKYIWYDIQPGAINDVLAYDSTNPALPIRRFEIAAVSPDLFDISYYSIEPQFGLVYQPRLEANKAKLGIPSKTVIRGDLGQSPTTRQIEFSVQDQIQVAEGAAPAPLHRPEAYYFVRDRSHLLTSWSSGETVFDFTTFPNERFGKCTVNDVDFRKEFKVPGGCASRGGRTGYSVKFISRNYLLSAQHRNGGEREAPGAILNPPPSGW